MNKKLHFKIASSTQNLKFGFIQNIFLVFLLMMSCGVAGQTTLYSTNFGTANNVAVSTLPGWTTSGSQATNLNLSTASVSSGYTLPIISSGSANLAEGVSSNTVGTAVATLAGQVNTVGYTSIEVAFGNRATMNYSGVVTLEWSSNGTLWNTISIIPNTIGWGATGWLSLPLGAQNQSNLRFRFSFVRSDTSGNFRIDDFVVRGTLSTPCSGTPNPGNTNATENPVVSGSTTVLSLQNTTSGSGVTYQWQSSTTSATTGFTNIASATAATYTASPTTKTWYRCVVTCSGNSTNSNPLEVNLTYCTPTYSNGPGTTDQITNVTLGTLSNNSGASASPFYTFYNAVAIPNIQQSSTASISVTFGSDVNQYAALWIDFNQNGIFESSEGLISTNANANGTYAFNISVPAGAVLGNTRMRIRGGDDNALTLTQSCGASNSIFGETEDYIVNIIPPCTPPTTQANAFTSSSITQNSATIGWTRGNGTAGVIVLARATSAVNSDPSSGNAYTANNSFGSGSQIGTNNFVVYQGAGNSVNLTGLLPSTNYHFAVYEYNSAATCYNLVELVGNLTTLAPPAGTFVWNGSVGSGWNNASNWTPNGVPGTTNNVIITGTGVPNILNINSDRTVTNFELAGSSQNSFNLASGNTLTITGNVTYSGTASATLNCASQVNITSSLPQIIPPLNYGALNAAGGNRTLLSGKTVGICYTFNPGSGLYAVDGSTLEYFSNSGAIYNLASFTYHNLKFSGTDTFRVGAGNTINVLGNFEQTSCLLILANGASANNFLNIDGDMKISGGFFDMNVIDGGKGTINLKGDLLITSAGTLDATVNTDALLANTNFNFTGIGNGSSANTTQTINVDFPNNQRNRRIKFNVKNGSFVQLSRDFDLGNKSVMTVETGGTLDFGFIGTTALNITGDGRNGTGFTSQSDATLIISSPQGIMNTSGAVGNIQTNTAPSISQTGNFYFVGKQNQMTGTALTNGSTTKNIFVNLADNSLELRLNNVIGIGTSGKLEIQKGTVIGATAVDFTGPGRLIMTDGEYRISTITATPASDFLPQLSGYNNYSLTGGTVTLNGINANQTLSATPSYFNLKIAGTNTLLANAKKISSTNLNINNELLITENAILDSESKAINGTANVVMDSNSRWRNSRPTETQPLLLGTYTFTNGTMEFYGSLATNNQVFRGGLTYHNIDINANATNSDYSPLSDFFNVSPASSFVLNGTLNVNSPAVFKLDSSESISGLGNIYVNPGSTFLYGSEYGIKTTGVSPTDGAIRTAGIRSFSSDASYGFIGGEDTMITGNALPLNVENLYIAKYDNTDDITLTNSSITIKNKLAMISGNIITGSNALTLGTNATNKGTLEYTSGFVKGRLTRWFNGANSNDATGLFPIGTTDNKNRFARIAFNGTSGGTLTASVNTSSMGITGVSTLTAIPPVGSCATFNVSNTEEFFWNIVPNGVSGNYTASFTRESTSTDPICEMTLLKRATTNWETQGAHIEPSGTSNMVTISRSGLTNFNDFGFGFKRCIPTIWNGTAWSNGSPSSLHAVTFSENFTTAGNLVTCECQINTGKQLTIMPNHTLEIKGNLNNSGTLIIENNGSLVQHDDFAANTGKIIMKRETQPMYRYDFTYWSSPLTQASDYKLADPNLAIPSLSPTTLWDKYYFWNATSQAWNTIPSGDEIMIPGKGYIVRAPQTYSIDPFTTQTYQAIFEGFPVNGIVNAPISATLNDFNLIGNPYPSAVSADLFLSNALNTSVVDGTIYLWTHNSPPSDAIPGSSAYNYTSSDYASYNFTGGTATAHNATTEPNTTINTPTGFIAAGQSFFIKSTGGGNAIFNNSMRAVNNNNQFFRTSNSNEVSQNILEKHRIWLNISNAQGAFNQTLVGYVQNATNGLERGFDGELMGGNYVTLYSIAENKNLTIQGRSLPFDVQDQVNLGFKTTIAGNFNVSIDHFDGLFDNQNIYLEDKLLNIINDLKQSSYDFVAPIGTFDTRFVLRYTNTTLGIGEFVSNPNDVIVYAKDKTVKAISSKENIESIKIYDLLGRMIYENNDVNSMTFSVSEITANQQALIVKLKLESGQNLDKKIIFN